jgi:hypothetical protein
VASLVLGGAAALLLVLGYRAFRLLVELRRHGGEGRALAEVALLAAALLLLGSALLAAIRLPQPRRVNLALALASSSATLYAFEAWHAADDPIANRVTEKVALIDALNRQGQRAYGGVEPARFVRVWSEARPRTIAITGRELLPLAGISRAVTVDCQEGEQQPWLVYVSDEHGFHNPPGLWTEAPVALAAVGDSFTLGSCVPSAENMVGALRQRYPSALNLGMEGSGPLIMLAELREYGRRASPRIVLWCHFGGNDLRDLRSERTHPLLVRYLEDGFHQGLAEQQAELDTALRDYYDSWLAEDTARLARGRVELSDWFALRATRTLLGLTFSDPSTFAPMPEEIELFQNILTKANRTVDGWGGRIVFVYLPAWSATPRQIGARAVAGLETATRDQVLSIARGLGLPVVDLAPDFAAHADPAALFACQGCHYSAAGYRLAAQRVLAALERLADAGGGPTSSAGRQSDAQQVGQDPEAARNRAEAAVRVIPPADRHLADPVAARVREHQQLEVE